MKKLFGLLAFASVLMFGQIASAQMTFHVFHGFETSVHNGAIKCGTTANGGDSFKVALSNTAITASWTQLSSVTQITGENGYTTGGAAMTTVSMSQTSGVMTWVGSDVSWTASEGNIVARYFVLYSDTSTNDLLVGWWDYGSSFTVYDGGDLNLDIGTLITVTTTASLGNIPQLFKLNADRYAALNPRREWLIAA